MARSLAGALDDLGVGEGERVAIVSPNAARFLVSLFGVSAFGRVLVPVNFRLNAEEIRYILEHSGSTVAPDRPGDGRYAPGPFRSATVSCSAHASDGQLFGRAERAHGARREPTRTPRSPINYTSGTTARPKGVQLTHRGCWLNAVTFGWHVGRVRP